MGAQGASFLTLSAHSGAPLSPRLLLGRLGMTRIASPTELDDVAALLDSCKEEDLAAILEAVDAPQSFLDPPGHISQEDGTRDAEEFCAPPATRVPAGEKPPKCASPALTAGELKRMLAEHKSSVIHEVRQLVTTENPAEDE